MTGVPLIGITCSYSENRISLDGDYVSAVERAGGVPIVIPACDVSGGDANRHLQN
jgi:hypothetical protein